MGGRERERWKEARRQGVSEAIEGMLWSNLCFHKM